ncbi:fungal-specific transcription factor domain-containing protein [Panaeolus papilionaceus]|nr:fungal-specific transcription factor domain-containing protein [Panaeolus papilionaceus]
MPTPPAESSTSTSTTQPSVPPQPLPPAPALASTKPTSTAPKKPRQRKRAEPASTSQQSTTTSASASAPVLVQSPVPPPFHSPRGPIFQPYPGPPYHIMNPTYPMNGSPYPQHPQHPQPPNPQHPSSMSPHPPPMHPQYAYPMHPGYSHPYPPYPQYPPQPMTIQPETSVPDHTAPSVSGNNKRKRKTGADSVRGKGNDRNSDDETGASGSDVPRVPIPQTQPTADLKKRTKTEPPVCQHCKQYSFECTFFLPITETRFKKKKLEEEAAEKEKSAPAAQVEPSRPGPSQQDSRDIAVYGPTSPAHLLHSQATINSRVYESYDQRYNHTFEVSQSGDGLIQVQKPKQSEHQHLQPKPVDLNIEPDVIQSLLNAYFTDVAPLLPIVTREEFLQNSNPPPVLIYSMCLVAAAKRDVAQNLFDSIRFAVNSLIKTEDVLSTASIVNVQVLLILCMTGDCHSQFVPNALSALWIRLGAAIRMAQDLGLHRAESVKSNIELRRRLWGICLVCDRWTSIAYGHPYMIDVEDCDARLPSSGDATDLYMDELVRLSIILGKVQKTIYSPSGLTFTSDAMLVELLGQIKSWKEGLPDHLQFKGPNSSNTAGLLHLLYSCVCMMFWRVFMRISYSCPEHLKFGLTVEQWTHLIKMTADAIDWLDANENIYDVWLLTAYAATSCALVQYHTCIRRKDEEAQAKLRKLKDCVRRWEASISPDHMSARRKTAEIISLLYEATQGPQMPMEAPALNPTGGVTAKKPVMLDYKKDPTRPGGGVFVAQEKSEQFEDVPSGTIISGASGGINKAEGKEPLLAAATSAAASSHSSSASNRNDNIPNHSFHTSRPFSPSPFAPPFASTTPGSYSPLNMAKHSAVNGVATPPISSVLSSPGNQQQSQQPSGAPMVNITPLTNPARDGNFTNVNPAMNLQAQSGSGNVQVMNVLDSAHGNTTLEDFQSADTGFLEGLPGGMFDWGQWDNFFSRFQPGAQGEHAQSQTFQQHQRT